MEVEAVVVVLKLERELRPSDPVKQRRFRRSEIGVKTIDISTGQVLVKGEMRKDGVLKKYKELYKEVLSLPDDQPVDQIEYVSSTTLDRRIKLLRKWSDFDLPKNSTIFTDEDLAYLLSFERLVLENEGSVNAAVRHIKRYGLTIQEPEEVATQQKCG